MKKHKKPESFIHSPRYPGGNKAMDEFVRSHLSYPEEALANRVEGTVAVDYDVDVFGKVIAAQVMHAIGYGCDEEALRVVKLLQFEKKKYKGLRVIFHKKIQIHFRLSGSNQNVPQQVTSIRYEITSGKKEDAGAGSVTYNITIPNHNAGN